MELRPPGWAEIQSRLRAAVSTDRPPRQVAGSFGFGLFLIALPNLGLSPILLGLVGYRFPVADARAFSAAVVLMNPVVKGGVYVASVVLGSLMLGPVPGGFSGLDLDVGRHVLARLLLGNLVIAWTVAVVGFYLALWLTRRTRATGR